MADGDYAEATLNRYAEAQARLEHAGGYNWRDRALQTLHGLGFHDDADLDRPLSTFSGGELTRASLGRALAGDPDLLLLDEPTNHLDIESLEWLEAHLIALDAAIVLVAHDRWFLEAVGTSVLELEAGRGRFFSGTWHQWRKEKAAQELALGRSIERQQAEIDRLERFVTRFRAGTRAKQAQSRAKKLAKIDRIGRDPSDGAGLAFSFAAPERSGRVVIELEHAELSAGDKPLLHDAELWLERGEHVSLVGANGTGKTTLIETLAGKRELTRPTRPSCGSGTTSQVGYLSQHAEELAAGGARTVIEAAQRLTGLKPGPTRALLGRFLFSGEDAEKPLDGLSGGERRRLSLAILVNSGANLLILDEPTNHLDLESREALEEALRGYPGSLLLVSHDRALLDAIGSRTIELYEQDLHSYVGGWPEYLRVRGEREAKPARASVRPPGRRGGGRGAGAAATGPRRPQGRESREGRERRAEGRAETGRRGGAANGARRLESEIEAAEAALRAVEDELSDSAAWASPEATRPVDRAPRGRQAARQRAVRALRSRRGLSRRREPVGRRIYTAGHGLAPPGDGSPARADRRRQRTGDGPATVVCARSAGRRPCSPTRRRRSSWRRCGCTPRWSTRRSPGCTTSRRCAAGCPDSR